MLKLITFRKKAQIFEHDSKLHITRLEDSFSVIM